MNGSLRALIRSRRTSFARSIRPKIGRRGLKVRANGSPVQICRIFEMLWGHKFEMTVQV